jgi:hypothetical protein
VLLGDFICLNTSTSNNNNNSNNLASWFNAILNQTNERYLLNHHQLQEMAKSPTSNLNFNDEHQINEYLHQFFEEKEKFKELFNEPFNILLPWQQSYLTKVCFQIFIFHFKLTNGDCIIFNIIIYDALFMN